MTTSPKDAMSHPTASRRRGAPRAALAATLATVALALIGPRPAGAHVEAEEPAVGPDGATTVEFSFDHGCDGQPTTSLRVQIPDGVTDVVPEPREGWQVQISASEFGWAGGSIPDAEAATFRAAMRVSGEAGTTIYFPTLQGCPTAELAWIERPDPDGPEPEDVAPSVTLTETIAPVGTVDGAGNEDATATTATESLEQAAPAAGDDEASARSTAGLVTIVVVVLLIGGGAAVLYLRYRGKGRV
jgi:uncharacterized protein YcnI